MTGNAPRRAPRRMSGWLRGLAVLGGFACSVTSSGAQEFKQLADLNIEVAADFPWPERLNRGFEPVVVYLRTEEALPRPVTVEVGRQGWGFEHRTTREVVLAAGEVQELELFVPAFGSDWGGGAEVTFSTLTSEARIGSGHAGTGGPESKAVLFVGEETLPEALLTVWGWRLSVRDVVPGGGRHRHFTSGSTPVRQVSTASVLYADLPRRFEPYTSLDLVIVDATTPVDAAALAPAFAAARLGSAIAVIGPEARRVARGVPALAAWMEPRFLLERDVVSEYEMGHGRLLISESEPVDGPFDLALLEALEDETQTVPADADRPDADRLRRFFEEHEGWVPDPDNPPGFFRNLAVPGMEELPYRAFVLLLIGFFVVIGPVNFFLVKRAQRPALLLLTIPGLAALSALGILAYGFLVQGIDLRVGSRTVTVLDQRDHRADTLSLRSFFAGLAPADGLYPGPTTACFPAVDESLDQDRLYLVDFQEGPVLRAEFLPVRRTATQLVVSERAARGRVLIEPAAGTAGWTATNGLEANVLALYLHAEDGTLHEWRPLEGDAPLLAGERRELVPAPVMPDLRTSEFAGWNHPWLVRPPRRSYVAVLDTNPFEDHLGLEADQRAGGHVVIGILADVTEAGS